MKKSDIYEISIKILGLFMLSYLADGTFKLISSIRSYSLIADVPFSSVYSKDMLVQDLIFQNLNILITLLLCWLFIFKTKWLVRRLCDPSDFEQDARLFAERPVIYEISLRITGLLLIAWTLPEFSFRIKAHITQVQAAYAGMEPSLDFMWKYGINIVLGCIMLLGAKGFAAYLGKEKSLMNNV